MTPDIAFCTQWDVLAEFGVISYVVLILHNKCGAGGVKHVGRASHATLYLYEVYQYAYLYHGNSALTEPLKGMCV